MNPPQRFAIIGSGPSAIFLLKHLLDSMQTLRPNIKSITVFEQSPITGMGMPYSPETTDVFNPSNISSEELPALPQSFAEWLRAQKPAVLKSLGIPDPTAISDSAIYSRLALGRYLKAQYSALITQLAAAGISFHEHTSCPIVDIHAGGARGSITLVTAYGGSHECDRLVIATGHSWPQEDRPSAGYYASPWPIFKLLPEPGIHYGFPVGTLGASLSAFDVVSSLAHRHGVFTEDRSGDLSFQPHADAEKFKVVMHTSRGVLPHLRFAQEQPIREIYRHIDRASLAALLDPRGFLRIDTYFDRVCRPALIAAFDKGDMQDIVTCLGDPHYHFADFIQAMSADHDYADPFEGMRLEMAEARDSLRHGKPIYWKEVIDDLMYTLNFHAHLLPAEDHQMLQSMVMPFLMNVIAAMPLTSGAMLRALHQAGRLELIAGEVALADDGRQGAQCTTITVENADQEPVRLNYRMFIDCGGQKPIELQDYPFPSLVKDGWARSACRPFANPSATEAVPADRRERLIWQGAVPFYLIGGIDIDATYRLIGADGVSHPRIHDISFPHTSGLRPYSYGLQACSDTSAIVVEAWVADFRHHEAQ